MHGYQFTRSSQFHSEQCRLHVSETVNTQVNPSHPNKTKKIQPVNKHQARSKSLPHILHHRLPFKPRISSILCASSSHWGSGSDVSAPGIPSSALAPSGSRTASTCAGWLRSRTPSKQRHCGGTGCSTKTYSEKGAWLPRGYINRRSRALESTAQETTT